ncbi:hypothetical protein ACFWYW_58650 [Nonomuraea sp. NPDC059023]|uniref:hypothetical protein n=1 Tax=unclassified Nonomuraea TaxID=2593643 RepID=UPI0036A153A7
MNDHRTALITGLVELAAFLEANPDIPTPSGSLTVHHFPEKASDAEMSAEVDRIADLLGSEIDPQHRPHGHYCTGISFGPIRFQTTAILADARARHAAENSYRDCVVPNGRCCTCNGSGLDNDHETCRDCEGSGIDNHGA